MLYKYRKEADYGYNVITEDILNEAFQLSKEIEEFLEKYYLEKI